MPYRRLAALDIGFAEVVDELLYQGANDYVLLSCEMIRLINCCKLDFKLPKF